MSEELEIKFMARANLKDELAKFINENNIALLKREELKLNNRYFDTPSSDLFKNGIALRVRQTNSQFEMTIKTKDKGQGGLFIHPEYNISLDEDVAIPNLSKFPPEIFTSLNLNEIQSNLKENMSQRCNRTIFLINFKETTIEISLDDVFYFSPKEEINSKELELELKEGNKQELIEFSLLLIKNLPNHSLFLGTLSKMQRAAFYATLSKAPKIIEFNENETNPQTIMRAIERNELNFLLTHEKVALENYIQYIEQLIKFSNNQNAQFLEILRSNLNYLNKEMKNFSEKELNNLLLDLISDKEYLYARSQYIFN